MSAFSAATALESAASYERACALGKKANETPEEQRQGRDQRLAPAEALPPVVELLSITASVASRSARAVGRPRAGAWQSARSGCPGDDPEVGMVQCHG